MAINALQFQFGSTTVLCAMLPWVKEYCVSGDAIWIDMFSHLPPLLIGIVRVKRTGVQVWSYDVWTTADRGAKGRGNRNGGGGGGGAWLVAVVARRSTNRLP